VNRQFDQIVDMLKVVGVPFSFGKGAIISSDVQQAQGFGDDRLAGKTCAAFTVRGSWKQEALLSLRRFVAGGHMISLVEVNCDLARWQHDAGCLATCETCTIFAISFDLRQQLPHGSS
jgi:hypothetical protein